MAKYSKTEVGALFRAIDQIHSLCRSQPLPYLEDLCNLYDKLSGEKYASYKSTYEFVTKGPKK